MKFQKKILTEMERCYSVTAMEISGRPGVYFASEGRHGSCVAFDLATLSEKTVVWEEPGGTMGMVPIPGRPGEFLAGQKFFQLYDWEEALVAWVRPDGSGGFEAIPILQLPYLHRFDILERDGKCHLIASTLAAHKSARDDWSCPGAVYTAPLPDDPREPLALSVQLGGLYQNHGYERGEWDGLPAGFVSGEQGVFALIPPGEGEQRWQVKKLMDRAVSDIAFADLDGDGKLEMAAIEPFHGCYYRVYRQKDGGWEMIYQHPEVSDFYHVAASGKVGGKPVFLGGCRRGKQQLFLLRWNPSVSGGVEEILVDEGVGPSNAILVNQPEGDVIYSANREKAQAAAYLISEEEG